ncbi:MAG: hypothetical protein A2Z17_03285 [Gammaproteobacteria bacterium RBG_16_66_13]|nr:MAG: hypothetical protein A2Z17_03285 [Gammaproteobacteria bacterium RBG_16_66_13]
MIDKAQYGRIARILPLLRGADPELAREFEQAAHYARIPAIATVEQEAEAVMIPSDAFRDWVRRYDLWREFAGSGQPHPGRLRRPGATPHRPWRH